jgi:hypothetical protein
VHLGLGRSDSVRRGMVLGVIGCVVEKVDLYLHEVAVGREMKDSVLECLP